MPDETATDTLIVPFSRPTLFSGQFVLRLAWLAVAILAGLYSRPPDADTHAFRFAVLGTELGLLAVFMVGWQVWLRRAGGPAPITLGPEAVTVPRGAASRRTVLIPYKDVRSVTVLGRGWWARLIFDTARGAYTYPLRSFAEPQAADRIRQALQHRVCALPDGAALWAKISARHHLAADLARPWLWGSPSAAAVLAACFALQLVLAGKDAGFNTIDAGANAAFLVRDGEWFRLVTGSLLHSSPQHVIGNVFMLVLLGTMLERLIGLTQFTLVLLASAVASQIASAAAGLDHGNHVYALGASGAVFGLLGALCVVTWRYRADLPGGYRLSVRIWVVLIGVNMVLLPLFQARVDKAGHLGGFLAGAVIGGLLIRGRGSLKMVAAPHAASRAALAAMGLAWAAGLYAAAAHARDTHAKAADRYALAHAMLRTDRFTPDLDNFVAWPIATDPAAPLSALSDARLLAHRGVAQARQQREAQTGRAASLAASQLAAITDTEASLDYRLGYPAVAAGLETGIANPNAAMLRHLALFLDRIPAQHAPADDAAMPSLALDHGTVRLSVPKPAADDGEIYALLHRGQTLLGIMLVQLPSGFEGEQVLPLPVRRAAPSTDPPPAFWTDGRTRVSVARYDPAGCDCSEPIMGPYYTEYTAQLSELP